MANSMVQSRRSLLLNSLPKPRMVKAKPDLNFLQNGSQLLRTAVARTGLSNKEAMAALGVDHESQFCEMLDGKQKLWMHQLLRPEAQIIWKELIFLAAQAIPGMTVERVVRLVESA